jgi:copper chaperone CopZ
VRCVARAASCGAPRRVLTSARAPEPEGSGIINALKLLVSDVATVRDQRRIEATLHSLRCVGRGSVDLDAGSVTVSYDPRCLDAWTVVTAIERLGYPVVGVMPTPEGPSTSSAGIVRSR